MDDVDEAVPCDPAKQPNSDAEPEPDPDLAMLRKHEPILAYTAGERFCPVGVEDYVRCCALRPGEVELVSAGELTTDTHVTMPERYPVSRLSLLLVQEPFNCARGLARRRASPQGFRGLARPSEEPGPLPETGAEDSPVTG